MRQYETHLPVVITVHDDGTVDAVVDLSEASDEAANSRDFVTIDTAVTQGLVRLTGTP